MEPIISVRGLRNAFGDQIIHDDLDIDVEPGEILGVVGGSGTGKSVLMRSIIGLQEPEAGDIRVFGESMRGKEEDEATDVRRRWGVLFQGGALFSTLTVAENVQVPLREFYPDFSKAMLDELARYKIHLSGLPHAIDGRALKLLKLTRQRRTAIAEPRQSIADTGPDNRSHYAKTTADRSAGQSVAHAFARRVAFSRPVESAVARARSPSVHSPRQ